MELFENVHFNLFFSEALLYIDITTFLGHLTHNTEYVFLEAPELIFRIIQVFVCDFVWLTLQCNFILHLLQRTEHVIIDEGNEWHHII